MRPSKSRALRGAYDRLIDSFKARKHELMSQELPPGISGLIEQATAAVLKLHQALDSFQISNDETERESSGLEPQRKRPRGK